MSANAGTDDAVARTLARAGRRVEPSAEQLQRWQRQLAGELAAVRRRRRARGALVTIAGCAAVLLLAIALWPAPSPSLPAAVARIDTSFGGVVVREASGSVQSLAAGGQIRAGQRVEVGARSGLGVTMAGIDVRLAAETTAVFAADAVELISGELYADTGSNQPGSLQVRTPAGEFEHVGTQYLVSVGHDQVIGAVREGRIVLHAAGGDVALAATDAGASMVVVSSSGEVSTRDLAPTAELWHWVADVSPGFVLVGRNADDALRWVARERGQRLEYTSPAARWAARSARLGGSGDSPVPAAEVVAVISAATELRAVAAEDGAVLSVSLASEVEQNSD